MLGLELIARGHQVTVFNIPDAMAFVQRIGIRYRPIGEDEYPLGSWHKDWAPALTGSNPIRDLRILNVHIDMAGMMLNALPDILKKEKVDVLLVDQLEPQGATLAEYMSIPFITICSILPIHPDPTGKVPCALAWWTPKEKITSWLLNKLSHRIAAGLARYYMKTVNHWRRRWQLKPVYSLPQTFSSLAQIGVIPEAFDFPRPTVDPNYHAVGPLIGPREAIPFPWERLDGRPVVYASLGTIRSNITRVLDVIMRTFESRPEYQLVLSRGAWIGKSLTVVHGKNNPIVVDYAPQPAILEKAIMCISHAGPGSVMECVLASVPIIAIPIADDQPAMAARVRFHKVGVVIPRMRLTVRKLNESIDLIAQDPTYKENVARMSVVVKKSGGVKRASDIIEHAVPRKYRPG